MISSHWTEEGTLPFLSGYPPILCRMNEPASPDAGGKNQPLTFSTVEVLTPFHWSTLTRNHPLDVADHSSVLEWQVKQRPHLSPAQGITQSIVPPASALDDTLRSK